MPGYQQFPQYQPLPGYDRNQLAEMLRAKVQNAQAPQQPTQPDNGLLGMLLRMFGEKPTPFHGMGVRG